MKKLTSVLLAAALLAGCASGSDTPSGASSNDSDAKSYKVAVVKQLDHASLDEIANAIIAELNKKADENGVEIEFLGTADMGSGKVYSGQNDQSTLQQIATDVLSGGADVIIPIATMAAATMAVAAEDTRTPVVFAAISDPEGADLTDIEYVTGTSDALNTPQIMDMMFAQNPDLNKVGLLYSSSEVNSEKPIAEAKAYLKDKGFKDDQIVDMGGSANSNEVPQAASALIAAGVQAVFTPTDNVIMDAEMVIAPMFAEAGIAHYAGADSFVRNGAFATCGVNYTDLGTETADLAFKAITDGIENTGYYKSFEVMPGGIITVNTETAADLKADYSAFSSFGTIVEVTTTED